VKKLEKVENRQGQKAGRACAIFRGLLNLSVTNLLPFFYFYGFIHVHS
jgi:hypothetical protein